jgi:ABC-type transport system involved in multi-copper enzyme maturation permease subunit
MSGVVQRLLALAPTNPIAVRVVSGASRRTRHLHLRAGYLGLMATILTLALLFTGSEGMRGLAARGAQAFTLVSYGQVLAICLLTPVFMAGAIAHESSPRTWEIMLTTPLSSAQIVLGNLLGRLFFVVALLLSTFPLFAVTQLFGGVSGGSIMGSYAIAASTAVLVGSIAIMLCVTRVGGQRAVFAFYVSVVAYLFVTYGVDAGLRQQVGTSLDVTSTTVVTPLNPFLTLEVLLRSNRYVVPAEGGFWMTRPVAAQAFLFLGLAVLLMAWSVLRVRLIGANERGSLGRVRQGGSRPASEVWNNGVAWRELHARNQGLTSLLTRWGFLAIGVAAAAVPAILHARGTLNDAGFPVAVLIVVAAESVIVALAALNASATAVTKEREDGSLDILLTTPIDPGAYLSGKLRGIVTYLWPMLAAPILGVAVAVAYSLARGLLVPLPGGTVRAPMVLPELAIEFPIVLIAFTAFCVMVGLQWSVQSKGTIGSVFAATGVAAAVAIVTGLCGLGLGREVSIVGPFLAGFNPLALLQMGLQPAAIASDTAVESLVEFSATRAALMAGAVAGAVAYLAIVVAIRASLRQRFMMIVRRLAGTA